METIVFNDYQLKDSMIEDRYVKARAVIINDASEMILIKYDEIYLLPGGTIDDGEEIIQGLIREIQEETGIEVSPEQCEDFLTIQHYLKDYPKRDNDGILSNRLNETHYFKIQTNQLINSNNMNLTENETQANFTHIMIQPKELLKFVDEYPSDYPKYSSYRRELVAIIQKLLNEK